MDVCPLMVGREKIATLFPYLFFLGGKPPSTHVSHYIVVFHCSHLLLGRCSSLASFCWCLHQFRVTEANKLAIKAPE